MESLSVALVMLVVAGVVLALRGSQALLGPRLTDDLAPVVLARAGFPVTPHNVVTLRERLGEAFLAEARRVSVRAGAGDPAWEHVDVVCERVRLAALAGDDPDLARWPQRVLDEIAEVDPAAAVDVARRCPTMLLDAVGSGRGLLGGSVFRPLPTTGTAPAGTTPVVSAAVPAPPAVRVAPALPAPRGPGDVVLPVPPRGSARPRVVA